tara:strand:+ start:10686 stop:11948 length:1263 start_codon:yes stop_codon:yes gene_type:complete
MADDMGQECLGTYGSKVYKTPNLDRLAEDGVKFNNCFATPLCSPSRVSIMTGKYNYRNYEVFLHIDPDEITFGNLFKDAGYSTAIAGKWQLGGDGETIKSLGFDEYCVNNIGKPKELIREANGRYAFPLMYQNGRFLDDDEVRNKYGPDIILDFVCDFIDKKKNKPFFIYYPMILVHSPFVPTPNRKDWLQTEEKDPKYFSDMVEYTDQIVGRLLNHLGERDLLANTLIIFTADNGTHRSITTSMNSGEKITGEKGMLTDAGLRVPLIASYQGKSPSRELDDLIDFSDILPTILQAANIKSSEGFVMDGRSFYPQIIGRKGRPRKWAFCHYDPETWFSDFNDHAGRVLMMDGYRMYHDGRLFSMDDRLNENQLPQSSDDQQRAAIRNEMEAVIATFPDYDFDKKIEEMKEIRKKIKANQP